MSRLLELQKMALDKALGDDPTPMSATSCYANSCIGAEEQPPETLPE
ncbi:hypothetical protein [Actinomadura sp. DC4]|nr:hypothetical protein [Actinomadura sp. DC4]MDN3351952.1 hypothetical protein [Actinomadura sp. DC4]